MFEHQPFMRGISQCAASVAPQRSMLLQVMPPERSHSLAAAGRQGARSLMSIALAVVMEIPRNNSPSSGFIMPSCGAQNVKVNPRVTQIFRHLNRGQGDIANPRVADLVRAFTANLLAGRPAG